MQPPRKITLNLREARADPNSSVWDLPPWGHPVSMMVMPLFINAGGSLFPIGSAFSVGRGLGFTMSAFHNIMEAVAKEPRFDRDRSSGSLPKAMTLSSVALSVLHQVQSANDRLTLNFLPLASVEGAPPTDIVIGHARLPERTPTLSVPLSFSFPHPGDIVWSLGYCDFRYPEGGIPIEAIEDGTFDWSEYSHTIRVVEAKVEASFTCRFARGYVDGPCFMFDENIEHGMSGGPVLSESGYLIGLNSAGAENFLGRPMAIASMLHPLLLTPVSFGTTLGPVTFKARRHFYDLIGQGIIGTDGSEQHIGFSEEEGAGLAIHAAAPVGAEGLFDDLAGYQSNSRASTVDKEMFHLVRR